MNYKGHIRLTLALLAALWLLVPASGFSQSLGEVARQYRKEREALEKEGEVPVKVFTNADITRMPSATSSMPSGRARTPPAPATPGANLFGPPHPTVAGEENAAQLPEGQTTQTAGGQKTKEYWQARFKAARAALSHSKQQQSLVEDELRLLQIQQARELDPNLSRKLNARIDASTLELETRHAATEKARQTLDETEKEFKESGAPQDWIQDGKGSD